MAAGFTENLRKLLLHAAEAATTPVSSILYTYHLAKLYTYVVLSTYNYVSIHILHSIDTNIEYYRAAVLYAVETACR